MSAREHIDDHGRFQSDKYPTAPPDTVPLKVTDPDAQDLLAVYALRRARKDAAFASDLLSRLGEPDVVGHAEPDPEGPSLGNIIGYRGPA